MPERDQGGPILLIEPPSEHLLNHQHLRPGVPLGIGYIMAALHSAGRTYEFLDLNAGNHNSFLAGQVARELAPAVIGVSCAPWSEPYLPGLLGLLRQAAPRALLVLGGVLVRYDPAKFLAAYPQADVGVRGEGEETFPRLLEALESHPADPRRAALGVPGLVVRLEGGLRDTGPAPLPSDLDRLASPFARGVFDLGQYSEIVMLLSARGCPHACTFCQWGGSNIPYRRHGLEYVVRELEALAQAGVGKIAFGDGTFNASTARLRGLRDLLARRGLRFTIYDADCRADIFTEEQALLLKDLGVVDVGFGLESVNPRTLALINKALDPGQVRRAVLTARPHIRSIHVSMIVGLPGETRQEVLATADFLAELPLDYVGVNALRWQEGTNLSAGDGAPSAPLLGPEECQELIEELRRRFNIMNPHEEHLEMRRRLALLLANPGPCPA